MKKIIFLGVLVAFLSCNSTEELRCLSYYVGTGIEFNVFNNQNEDLLDPESPNHLDTSKIKIFYVVNGETQKFYNRSLDLSRGFIVYKPKDANAYRIGINLNTLDKSKKTITYIQWDEKDRDTIESTFDINECYIKKDKVWLNGKLIWNQPFDDGNHQVEIRK